MFTFTLYSIAKFLIQLFEISGNKIRIKNRKYDSSELIIIIQLSVFHFLFWFLLLITTDC